MATEDQNNSLEPRSPQFIHPQELAPGEQMKPMRTFKEDVAHVLKKKKEEEERAKKEAEKALGKEGEGGGTERASFLGRFFSSLSLFGKKKQKRATIHEVVRGEAPYEKKLVRATLGDIFKKQQKKKKGGDTKVAEDDVPKTSPQGGVSLGSEEKKGTGETIRPPDTARIMHAPRPHTEKQEIKPPELQKEAGPKRDPRLMLLQKQEGEKTATPLSSTQTKPVETTLPVKPTTEKPEGGVPQKQALPSQQQQILAGSEEGGERASQEQRAKSEIAAALQEGGEREAAPPKKRSSVIPSLRTYKGDISRIIKREKTSLVSIATAEEERRKHEQADEVAEEKKERIPFPVKKFINTTLSTVLIIAGIALIVFVYLQSRQGETVIPRKEIPAIIFAEDESPVDISDLKTRRKLLDELSFENRAVDLRVGEIKQLYLVDSGPLDTAELVSAQEFLNILEARVTTAFLRSLEPTFMFGTHVFANNEPFLILKVASYENAFKGMLEWEDFMNDDLTPLFGPLLEEEIPGIGSGPIVGPPRVFTDLVLKNRDTRVRYDKKEDIALLYTFPNKETLIITTNEHTLTEILSRLTTSRVQQ